jgi:prophage DNA circulation protein
MPVLCRDWTTTLWNASFMGVPFYFESDDEDGGRALKVHEFPGSDNPFVEDNGRKSKYFSGSAYVTGDDADTHAIALAAVLDSQGPGALVIPMLGPVQAHCEDFKRHFKKDELGRIGFDVKFVRDGNATPLVSVPLLGQNVFDAADGMASALAALYPNALTLNIPADYVIAAAVDMVQTAAGAIELCRQANPVDPDTSAQVASANAAIVEAAPLLISSDPVPTAPVTALLASAPPLDETFTDPTATLAAVLVATVRLLADGMADNPDAGAGAFLALALDFPAPTASTAVSANAGAAAANSAAIVNLTRLAALTAWCEALERQPYASRSDGVAARADAAEYLGFELDRAGGAANAGLYVALQTLRGNVVQYLTELIATLAPVVTVTLPQSMPSLWCAWRLYQDPTRVADLVGRNEVRHPSFMPLTFQALAPGFAAPPSLPTQWPAP